MTKIYEDKELASKISKAEIEIARIDLKELTDEELDDFETCLIKSITGDTEPIFVMGSVPSMTEGEGIKVKRALGDKLWPCLCSLHKKHTDEDAITISGPAFGGMVSARYVNDDPVPDAFLNQIDDTNLEKAIALVFVEEEKHERKSKRFFDGAGKVE